MSVRGYELYVIEKYLAGGCNKFKSKHLSNRIHPSYTVCVGMATTGCSCCSSRRCCCCTRWLSQTATITTSTSGKLLKTLKSRGKVSPLCVLAFSTARQIPAELNSGAWWGLKGVCRGGRETTHQFVADDVTVEATCREPTALLYQHKERNWTGKSLWGCCHWAACHKAILGLFYCRKSFNVTLQK